MKLLVNCGILLFLSIITTSWAEEDPEEGNEEDPEDGPEEGFLNVTCNAAQDCYVLDNINQGLWLACWYNVKKCKCQNTISSNFHLKWENNQCLMSKYGPCGDKGTGLAVGCSDGFICVDNNCRDPRDPKSVKLAPYVFDKSKCTSNSFTGCKFSADLRLECHRDDDHCVCDKIEMADGRSTSWDIRNYDGDNNCSVGQFGPCGTKNGITIACHGNGISCVNGTCINPNHQFSEVGEDCESVKNCKKGLLCSLDSVCIEPFSVAEGKICAADNECRNGLKCERRPDAGPWSFAICTKFELLGLKL